MASHVWGTRTLLFTLEVLPSLKAQWSLEKGREQGWGSILGFVVSFWFCLTPNSRKPMICSFYQHITKGGAREAQDKLSLWPLLSGFKAGELRVKDSLGASAGSHCCCCVLPTPSTSSAAPLTLPTLTCVDHCRVVAVQSCFWSLLAWRHCNVANNNNTCMIMHWLP